MPHRHPLPLLLRLQLPHPQARPTPTLTLQHPQTGPTPVTEGDDTPFVPPVQPPSSLLGVRSLPHAPVVPEVAAFSLRDEAHKAADVEHDHTAKLVAAGAAAEAMGPEQRIECGLPPLMIGSNAALAAPTGNWELLVCHVLHIVSVAEAILGADEQSERGHAQRLALLVVINFQTSVMVVPLPRYGPSILLRRSWSSARPTRKRVASWD